MLSQNSNIEVKPSQSRCRKFFRVCLGGIIGSVSAVVMPLAQWLLNIRDKVQEQEPENRLRWPAILDIGASAVVAYGAVVRFGNPALWCIYIVEGCLSIYGFIRGVQITSKSNLSDIPKVLWSTDISTEKPNPVNTYLASQNITTIERSANGTNCIIYNSKQLLNLLGGSLCGIPAALLMPSVQTLHHIQSTKRRWPPLINGGVLTYYALYVGSVYIGKDVSLLLLARLGQALSIYGCLRGGYIGYKEDTKKVFTLMWRGGMNTAIIENKSKQQTLVLNQSSSNNEGENNKQRGHDVQLEIEDIHQTTSLGANL